MKIDDSGACFLEQIIFDLCRPDLGIGTGLVVANEAAIFGFNADNAVITR
jgi:hypothetical protein